MKFGVMIQNDMDIVEIETGKSFNMADLCFSNPEIVISQPWIELFQTHCVNNIVA